MKLKVTILNGASAAIHKIQRFSDPVGHRQMDIEKPLIIKDNFNELWEELYKIDYA